jgi:hypothetical protein
MDVRTILSAHVFTPEFSLVDKFVKTEQILVYENNKNSQLISQTTEGINKVKFMTSINLLIPGYVTAYTKLY